MTKALKCGVFDGFYAKHKFINGVCALGLTAIGKLRADADMRYLYTGAYNGHVRPKSYDGKVRIEDLHRLDSVGQIEPNLFLYTAIVHHVTLKRKIRLALPVNISIFISTHHYQRSTWPKQKLGCNETR